MIRRRKSSKKPLFFILAVVLVVGASLLWWKLRPMRQTAQPVDKPTIAQSTTKTYKATSEGSTFDVPESVPKSSIKNYELVTENEQFKIRKDSNNYIITLYAIINRPDQYDGYKDQLREYKQNALQYLSDQGISVESLNIIYEPAEASQL